MSSDGSHPRFRGWRSPATAAILVLVVLVLSIGMGNVGAHPPVAGPAGNPSAPTALSSPGTGRSAASPVHPATTQYVNGTFLSDNSNFSNLPPSSYPCGHGFSSFGFPPYYNFNETYKNCYGGAQEPSALPLANGNLGVAYSVLTTNHTACVANASQVVSRVGFQVSTDGGATFGNTTFLGNESCSYLNAIEPSFTVSSTGAVDGVFVQSDNTSTNNSANITLPTALGNRTNASLGFVTSADNGTTFSNVTTLTTAGWSQIASPRIASFGQSIYVVYDRLNNWTNLTLTDLYPYYNHPSAVELIYSADAGVTWNGPYTLPGLNATQGYNAYDPSVSVSTAGTLAVSYDTNRSCTVFPPFLPPFCNYYSDSVVVATSATNGSTWSAPAVIAPSVGESHCQGFYNDTGPTYWPYCYAYKFQDAPQSAVGWSDSNPNDLYVAWDGEYSWFSGTALELGYGGLWAAASTTGGATWTQTTLSAPEFNGTYNTNYLFNVAITVHSGKIYLAYSDENETYCYGSACSPFANDYSFWLDTSSNGVVWNPPSPLAVDPTQYYNSYGAWLGYTDAVTYQGLGPVVVFAQPFGVQTFFEPPPVVTGTMYWYTEFINSTAVSELTVAAVRSAASTAVTFTEHGLPSGSPWGFDLGSLSVQTNATSVVVGNVPKNLSLPFIPLAATVTGLFWTEYAPVSPGETFVTFTGPTTEPVNYTAEYGIELYVHPATLPFFDIYFNVNGAYYQYYFFGFGLPYAYPAFPWYFAAGTQITLGPNSVQATAPVSYYSGTGNGSSTVFSNVTTITVNAPINETLWFGAFGSYDLKFVPLGLPATSVYQFTFDGAPYSANATTNISIPSVITGAYTVAAIQATAATAGWEYFGSVPGGDLVVVPAEPIVFLNFSYAEVDVAAPTGTVSFHATGLVAGDVWRMSFNGTEYSSSTPWINLTEHPGTYAVAASPVSASSNDTTAYAPVGFGPQLSVTTGSTYTIVYTNAYRVQAFGGPGGSVTGGGSYWLPSGSMKTFTASAHANYVFDGWVGTGSGSYSGPSANASVTVGGPITEAASFVALPVDRFNLTFNMVGLPAGAWWTVIVDGTGYSSNLPTLVVSNLYPCSSGALGQYSVSVPYAYPNGTAGVRYTPGSYPASVCTTGTTAVTVTFTTEYLATPLATPGGTASVVLSGVSSRSPVWVPSGSTVGFEESPQSGYAFAGWVGLGAGNYSGATANVEVTPHGAVAETAEFQVVVLPPPTTWTLTVQVLTSLPSGTTWSLTLDGIGYAGTGGFLNITGLAPGVHVITVGTLLSSDRLTQYLPATEPPTVDLTSNQSFKISYTTAYWVSESATSGGSLTGAVNGFITSGKTVALNATPSAGDEFVGWSGTGAASYTGTNPTPTVTVTSPVAEVATFAPIPAASSSGSSNPLSSPVAIAGLAVVGLLVGVVVGYVVFRRRNPPTGDGSTSGGSA